MAQRTAQFDLLEEGKETEMGGWAALGEAFLNALATQSFDALENLMQPEVHFRALLPSSEVEESTSAKALGWFQHWFGNRDALQIRHSVANRVFDRLYIAYRLRVHHPEDGWRLIEQQMYCVVQDGRIADLWLLCSGFRPDFENAKGIDAQSCKIPQRKFGGDAFYNAGDRGCAEGPLEEIAAIVRKLKTGQALEIYATDPSVASDLGAWCRLSGHVLEKNAGNYFLIRHG